MVWCSEWRREKPTAFSLKPIVFWIVFFINHSSWSMRSQSGSSGSHFSSPRLSFNQMKIFCCHNFHNFGKINDKKRRNELKITRNHSEPARRVFCHSAATDEVSAALVVATGLSLDEPSQQNNCASVPPQKHAPAQRLAQPCSAPGAEDTERRCVCVCWGGGVTILPRGPQQQDGQAAPWPRHHPSVPPSLPPPWGGGPGLLEVVLVVAGHVTAAAVGLNSPHYKAQLNTFISLKKHYIWIQPNSRYDFSQAATLQPPQSEYITLTEHLQVKNTLNQRRLTDWLIGLFCLISRPVHFLCGKSVGKKTAVFYNPERPIAQKIWHSPFFSANAMASSLVEKDRTMLDKGSALQVGRGAERGSHLMHIHSFLFSFCYFSYSKSVKPIDPFHKHWYKTCRPVWCHQGHIGDKEPSQVFVLPSAGLILSNDISLAWQEAKLQFL